jgi:hypothetical protein
MGVERRFENALDAHELREFSVTSADVIGDPDVDQVHHVHREHGIRRLGEAQLHFFDHLAQFDVLRGMRLGIGIAVLQESQLLGGAMAPCVVFQAIEDTSQDSRAVPGLNGAVQRIDHGNEPSVVFVEYLNADAKILRPLQQHGGRLLSRRCLPEPGLATHAARTCGFLRKAEIIRADAGAASSSLSARVPGALM